MTTQKKEFNKKHNVQIPMEVLLHPEITGNMIKVFAYMKFRYQFFVIKKKKQYFESLDTIANAVSISKRTVNDCVNSLESFGFIQKLDKKDRFGLTNNYKVRDCLIDKAPDVVTYVLTKEEDNDSCPF
jgi:DNA replication protein DnaD